MSFAIMVDDSIYYFEGQCGKIYIALTLQIIRVNIFLWHNGILKNFHKNNIDLINFKLQ